MLKHFIIWNNCLKIEVACSIGVFLPKKMIWLVSIFKESLVLMTVKYLNGQTALDWIRMGYLNELIARDLPTPLTIIVIFVHRTGHTDRTSIHLSDNPIQSN